ncbi:hypothetical protein HMPREF0645_0217 [Hallella bergensis DSM 17361]|uniref:Uncharacterized protein n=1 Tax=Hallella bergensis DSM 17361 TaxID=585502 RepID=D1PTD2_9BACT|nr:hypothetical protein HMPREF0645_0217 [Hallella bergensis DSM 17361]
MSQLFLGKDTNADNHSPYFFNSAMRSAMKADFLSSKSFLSKL